MVLVTFNDTLLSLKWPYMAMIQHRLYVAYGILYHWTSPKVLSVQHEVKALCKFYVCFISKCFLTLSFFMIDWYLVVLGIFSALTDCGGYHCLLQKAYTIRFWAVDTDNAKTWRRWELHFPGLALGVGSHPRYHHLGGVLRAAGEGVSPVAYFRLHIDCCFQRRADRQLWVSNLSCLHSDLWMGEQKDHAESTHEGIGLAGQLAGGFLLFRWVGDFPPRPLSARSKNEVAKQSSLSTLLAGETMWRKFVPSSWTSNQSLQKCLRGNSTGFCCGSVLPVQGHQSLATI